MRKLKGTNAKIDLSRKKLRDPSAIVIAALLRNNASLTSLDVASNAIGEDGMQAMGTSLLESTSSKLGALKCDAFEVRAGEIALDLSRKKLRPAAVTLLSGMVKHNITLRTVVLNKFAIRDGNDSILDLSSKSLDDTDVVLVAKILGNGALPQITELWLNGNQIGDAGVSALAGACATGAMAQLKVSWRLTALPPRLAT